MSHFDSDISAALSSEGPVPKEKVLTWIASTADSDLQTLSKLYRLTGESYYRIQPELGREATCTLVQRYLLGCIREGVTDNENIEERYEAAQTLHDWFRHLLEMEEASAVLAGAANSVTNLFLESGEDVRNAIETGFLEHALETAALRPYFEHWASDPRLQPAWNRALEWGQAHPDYVSGLFERLKRAGQE